jgi:hypothetical protein
MEMSILSNGTRQFLRFWLVDSKFLDLKEHPVKKKEQNSKQI